MPNELIQDLRSRIIESQKIFGKFDLKIKQQNESIHELKVQLKKLGEENEHLKKLLKARNRSMNKLQASGLKKAVAKTPAKAVSKKVRKAAPKKPLTTKATAKPKAPTKKELLERKAEARKLSSELKKLKGGKIEAPTFKAPKTTVKSANPKALKKSKA